MLNRSLTAAIALSCVALMAQGGQFCRDDIAATAPDSRFQDNGDGTVTDLATGLVWKQCAEGLSGADCSTGNAILFTWQQALQHTASNSGWRLPNKNELASLVERRCYDPAINIRFFPHTPSSIFWCSSPYARSSSRAWSVALRYGHVESNSKNDAHYVRMVQGGQ